MHKRIGPVPGIAQRDREAHGGGQSVAHSAALAARTWRDHYDVRQLSRAQGLQRAPFQPVTWQRPTTCLEPEMPRRLATRTATVDAIYSAAAAPELWPNVLTRIARDIGAIGGMIARHAAPGEPSTLVTGGLDDDITRLYLRRYVRNPWGDAMRGVPFGQIVQSSHLVDLPTLHRSAFHADILMPQSIHDNLSWAEPSMTRDGSIGGFAFPLPQRGMNRAGEALRCLKRLQPHLSRALEISVALGRHADGGRQLAQVLQIMPRPALLLDGRGRIVHANPPAEALLRAGDGLTVTMDEGPRLVGRQPDGARALSRALATSLSVAAGGEQTLDGLVHVAMPSGGPPLLVLLSPLPPSAFALWHLPSSARVLVLIVGPTAPAAPAAEALRTIFGLTAAEARVAALVGGGLSGPHAAAALKVSTNTVKTLLARCFDKMGIHSQAELTQLLGALPAMPPSPLKG